MNYNRWKDHLDSTYINSGLSTDFMWVNEARLTISRSTDSARTGGDNEVSSVDVIGVDAFENIKSDE